MRLGEWICMNMYQTAPKRLRKLLLLGQSSDSFLEMEAEEAAGLAGLTARETARLKEQLLALGRAREELSRFEESGMSFAGFRDEAYPDRLRTVEDAPAGLFYLGRLPDEKKSSVAIVGARACSAYGKACAAYFAKGLSEAGVQVVSGMAYGIDKAAQEAALIRGSSFAVLAGGADICYPKAHMALYERLIEEGGVLSEMPPGTQGTASFFPRRNRIISGLSDAVVVIEARQQSGSLITANLAAEQGRLVYGVPGSIDSVLSRGTHALIRGGAILLGSVDELLEDLRMPMEASIAREEVPHGQPKRSDLSPRERDILALLGERETTVDELLLQSAYPIGTLMDTLLSLELKGCVTRLGLAGFRKIP